MDSRIRAPRTGCSWRIFRSSGVSGPLFARIIAGTPIFPSEWNNDP